ncbi:cyclic lactone autoinducer peptide [Papillibacter cinnamivorans]
MKKILSYIASSAAALFVLVSFASAGTCSIFTMYQPKVPSKLLK